MSDEPRRLLDDPELGAGLGEDLRAAAEGGDVRYDEAAGAARLAAAIAGLGPASGGQHGGAGPSTPPGPAGSAVGASKAFVWTATAAAVIAGAVGLVALGRTETPKPAPAPNVIASAAALAPKPVAPVTGDSTPTLALSALPVESAAPAAPKPSASMSPEDKLRAETQQLVEVRTAAQSDPARAVTLAAEGHAKFKGGVFYQEREALAISALVRLGRMAEAKSRGKAFLASFPKGPYAERVRQETGLGAPPAGP